MKKIIISLILLTSLTSGVSAWTNPLTLNGEWYLYGIGDPYIMKYRGTYYLYASTKDNNVGVKCWSTKDFITWSNVITCSVDPITKTAYAPEVFYWNGVFYMYTSPGGGGHYVLSSTSPTGPFTRVTGNLGKSIDGSVFMNDDGNLYFYHSDNSSIMGCEMSSPTNIGNSVNLGARVGNGWTEGPSMFKRNGIYYLIYTGNHVISKAYRIDYATSVGGPLSKFTPQVSQNPILIDTEGSHVGLGHGSPFVGPDLDSYYYTYHNLAGDYGVGPYRRLNFERMAWNGDKMLILGPTTWEQQPMQQADMADFFEREEIGANWMLSAGGSWSLIDKDYLLQDKSDDMDQIFHKAIHNLPTGDDYTAEFTLKGSPQTTSGARYGVVFGYTDEQNFGIATLLSNVNQLEVKFLRGGVWDTPNLVRLPTSFKHDVWHGMRIEKVGINYKVFVDGMLKVTTRSNLGAGKIGYMTSWCEAHFGYIAFSNKVNGSGIFDINKPVPGSVEAVHYNGGGIGVGYSDLTLGNSGGKYIRNDDVDICDASEGGFAITANQSGEWYKYNVNVESNGVYNVGIRYATNVSTSQVRIWQGDTDVTGIVTLPSTGGMNTWSTFTIKGLQLTKGYQQLKVEIVTGGFDFYKMQFEHADNAVVTITETFDSVFSSKWNYSDGTWAVINGEAVVDGFGKRTLGNTGWSDFTVITDVTYTNNMNAGLIFRVNNPAMGGAGKDPQLGTDFYQGYFVSLGQNSVVLGKQNYNWQQLATAVGSYSLNKKYTLKVEVLGPNIKVFVDDMNTPKIDYTDPDPFINGKVGLRSHNSYVRFDNFSVTTTYNEDTSGLTNTRDANEIAFYPNPVSDHLTIFNVEDYTDLVIYKLDGQRVCNLQFVGSELTFDVGEFNQGLYLLQLRNGAGKTASRKFLKH